MQLRQNKFLKWCATSLIGNTVLFGITWLLIVGSVCIAMIYSEGSLTFTWALYIILINLITGPLVGAIAWWTITQPMLKNRDGR